MKPTKTYDQERENFNVAKLKKGGQNFEVVIDPDLAVSFKEGNKVEIHDILKAEHIYFDAKKGEVASEKLLHALFETEDPLKIAEVIMKEGEIQLTQEHREKVREVKRRKIIDIIHRNAADPKTHLPHPVTRIENAFEEAKVKIDEFKTAENQIQEIIKQLRVVLPIKFEIKELAVKIPSQYAAKAYSAVSQFGKITKDDWQNDGSWMVVVEIPAGLQNDFMDKLNSMTHGSVDIKILSSK
jgi:ribosome maturation protein SDO1